GATHIRVIPHKADLMEVLTIAAANRSERENIVMFVQSHCMSDPVPRRRYPVIMGGIIRAQHAKLRYCIEQAHETKIQTRADRHYSVRRLAIFCVWRVDFCGEQTVACLLHEQIGKNA